MKLLITGVCGYVGSRMALRFMDTLPGVEIYGIDNLSRSGAETSITLLSRYGIHLIRGDIRLASDMAELPDVDWIIDCAANPTVLAGVGRGEGASSRQLMQHNLGGTLNILEYCREHNAGLILLSTSRVYSIPALCNLPLHETETRYVPLISASYPVGFSSRGVNEAFSTAAPISLYGATKLASEVLALEYALAFDFPLWINRCGVIGGPGQFGKVDQGILSFWIYSFLLRRPLRYIGFGGSGKQVRDFVMAEDVADLVLRQIQSPSRVISRTVNVGGGNAGALSLYELTQICREYFGSELQVAHSDEVRLFDIPYYVTDITNVFELWDWRPSLTGEALALHVCEWAAQQRTLVESLMSI